MSWGKTVKFFLGGWWSALHMAWSQRSAPQKEGLPVFVLYRWGNQEREFISCRIRTPNYCKKFQRYLMRGAPSVSCGGTSTDLGAQQRDSLLCWGLPAVWEEATHCTGTCLFIAMREAIKTRSDQGTTYASWSFRQNDRKKKKFQLQPRSGWSSLFEANWAQCKDCVVNQNIILPTHEGVQLQLIRIQQFDFSLLWSIWLFSFNTPLMQVFVSIIPFGCISLFLLHINMPSISNLPQYWRMRRSVMMKTRHCTIK